MPDGRKENTVLIVDDTPENIDLLGDILNQDYKIKVALKGEKALKIAASNNPPDIILLDIMMPGMDGYEVCRRLKADPKTQDIPVIFVTAMSEVEDETRGFETGAIDYITKPISPPIVKARVNNHLELKAAREYLKNQNDILEQRVEERTTEVLKLQQVEFDLRASKEKIENELNIAAGIQGSILPSDFSAFSAHPAIDLYAMMTPAREIGGDFYDFFFVDDDHLVTIIADVSGKGVPAALFMMVSRTIMRSIARRCKSPAQVLTETNDILCEGNEAFMFVTAFLAFYHLPTGHLTYCSGGHHPALLLNSGGGFRELAHQHGPGLGYEPGYTFKEDADTLEPGQTLVLYTDGVTEASSPQDDMYGFDRFASLLQRCQHMGLSQMFDHLEQDLKEFQQGIQFDDTTLLALKREM